MTTGFEIKKKGGLTLGGIALPGIVKVTDSFDAGLLDSSTPSQTKKKIEDITGYLRDPVKFKAKLLKIWYEDNKHSAKLDSDGVQAYLEKVQDKLGIPVERFGDLEEMVFVYDFDGNGLLSFNEVVRMIRHELVMYRRDLAGWGASKLDVRTETVAQAGYKNPKLLGAGGQGTAYLVDGPEPPCNGGKACLKQVDMSNMNAGNWDEIKEEVLTMRKFQHPCIAANWDFFQSENMFYMVGEPYMGGDLEKLQQKARAQGVDLDETWYQGIFQQCFEALEHLHKNAVVHADIKEPNIMVRTTDYQEPEIVIIDLGLAKTIKGATKDSPSGTPGYMPPEVWQYRKWYPTGDVFSMGVVVCDMLMNSIPNTEGGFGVFQKGFPTGGINAVINDTCTKEIDYDGISEDYGDVVSWLEGCMQKEYAERSTPQKVLAHPWFKQQPCSLCSVQ